MCKMRLVVVKWVCINCFLASNETVSLNIHVKFEFCLLLDHEFLTLHGLTHLAALTIFVVYDLNQLFLFRRAFR